MTVYLDSSALVKLVVAEAESGPLLDFLAARPVQATSIVALTEVRRAVMRRPVGDPERVSHVLARAAVISLSEDIAGRAGLIGAPWLRSLDAIHLASALELGSDLEALVTYDDRLVNAALALGLPAVAPGANAQASIEP